MNRKGRVLTFPAHNFKRLVVFSFIFSLLVLTAADIVYKQVKAQTVNYIGGYVFPVSAKHGESVNLHLSTTAKLVTIEIFRQGVIQEKIAQINDVSSSYLPCGHHSEVGCFFPVAYSLPLTEEYPPGLYLVKFTNQENPEEKDIAYFVVKASTPGSLSKIAVVLPLNTWEVHNFREGKKVYPSPYSPGYENRARSASFLRPWDDICSNLEEGFPMGVPAYIWWLESQGYFPEYLTDIDLDKFPGILDNYKMGISVAHHEYWSWGMRDAVENYTNNGGHFLFLSGNVSWWQVRYEDDYSLIRVFKLKEEDPYYFDNNPDNDHLTTVNWAKSPVNRPETLMTGTSFGFGGFWNPTQDPDAQPGFTVYRTNDPEWGWVFNDTGLKDGDVIGKAMFQHMVENDGTLFAYDSTGLPIVGGTDVTLTPENFKILGISQTTYHGAALGHAVMGIRETPGGGIVFAGSQEYFSGAFSARDPAVEKIILNLLARLVPGEQKEKRSLPYSDGGLKIYEFEPALSTSEFNLKLESAACSLNSGYNSYWIWVLTEQADDSGSFRYSLNEESNWFSLKPVENSGWTIITEPTTGMPKQFNLNSHTTYSFRFSPRITSAKIKKILFTNVQYFYPSRLLFENKVLPVINLSAQTPNVVQPKLVYLNPSQDSYIESWSPTTNFGSNAFLKMKNDGVDKSLIDFDLQFLQGAKLNRAFLKLYLAQNSKGYQVNVAAALLKKEWQEKEVNWQQPKTGFFWESSGVSGQSDYDLDSINFFNQQKVQATGQWYYFEVTSQLKSYLENPADFNGFLIIPFGENSASTYLSFASNEYPWSDYHPILEINYLPLNEPFYPTPTPTSTIIISPTPTLTPTPSLTASPTPTPALPTPSETPSCQPIGEKTSLYFQPGSGWASPPYDKWDPNLGALFQVNEPIKLEEIKIKIKNYGGGQKSVAIALTPNEGKKLENDLPAPLLSQTTGIIPCCYYEGWINFDLNQSDLILEANKPYFVWLKDTNGYHAFTWVAGSLEILGKRCLSEDATPTPTASPTPTLAVPSLTATPTPTQLPPSPSATPNPDLKNTIVFQQGMNGYSGAKDTYFYIYDYNNNCQSSLLKVGHKQQNSTLIYFDLSSLPYGTIINDAKLQIYASGWGGNNINIGVFKIKRGWNDCLATYITAGDNNNWEVSGCKGESDRDLTPFANFLTNGILRWYEIDLTSLAQQWTNDSETNKGILIGGMSNLESGAFYFAGSESEQSIRPKLIITY